MSRLEVVGRIDLARITPPLAALLLAQARRSLQGARNDPIYPVLMEISARTQQEIERLDLVLRRPPWEEEREAATLGA